MSNPNDNLSNREKFWALLDVSIVGIGVLALLYNDKFVGAGLVATGVSLLKKWVDQGSTQ